VPVKAEEFTPSARWNLPKHLTAHLCKVPQNIAVDGCFSRFNIF
jgi:hypothetical protein